VEEHNNSMREQEFNIQTNLIVRESTGFPPGTMAHLQRGTQKA